MTYDMAMSLCSYLRQKSPYDTGALQASIQAPQGNETEWLIVIGNDDSSINGTPTNQYASILNDATDIARDVIINKKTKETRTKIIPNRHYKWVNNAILEWFKLYGVGFNLIVEDDDIDE